MDKCEQELEFDRLELTINQESVRDFIKDTFSDYKTFDNQSIVSHMLRVGSISADFSDMAFEDFSFFGHRYWKKVCEISGYLHDVILFGYDFEDVTLVGDSTVTKIVATLTPDIRKPFPKRIFDLANTIGLANLPTQIIKLADIQDEVAIIKPIVESLVNEPEWLLACDKINECTLCLNALNKINSSDYLNSVYYKLKKDLKYLNSFMERR